MGISHFGHHHPSCVEIMTHQDAAVDAFPVESVECEGVERSFLIYYITPNYSFGLITPTVTIDLFETTPTFL